MSWRPDWVGPSGPINPPCVPTNITGALLKAVETLISTFLPLKKEPKL